MSGSNSCFLIFFFAFLSVSALLGLAACEDFAEEAENDDWFDWDDQENNDGSPGKEDEVEKSKTTQKRWNKAGICDHDMFTSIILRLILDFQSTMKTGDNVTNFPPMDPIRFPDMNPDLVGENKQYRIKINLRNITVSGLSTFTVTGITSDFETLASNISLAIDSLSIFGKIIRPTTSHSSLKIVSIYKCPESLSFEGRYSLKGGTKFGIISIPIFGNGAFSLQPKQIEAYIYTKFTLLPNTTMIMEEFDYGVKFKKLDPNFTGFMFAEKLSKLLAHILKALGVDVFKKLEPKIHEKLRSFGMQKINRLLWEWEYDEETVEKLINQSVNCYLG